MKERICYNNKGPGITAKKKRELLKCFILDDTVVKAAKRTKVHPHTAHLWYRKWRETIYHASERMPRFFGEVQVDQHEFGGRRKKKDAALVRQLAGLPAKEIIARGKKIRRAKRALKFKVFGILQTGGDVYAHIIKDEKADTLMPIIRRVVEVGSTIYSDKWASFNKLSLDGYKHTSINHSVEYVDKKGRHINGIENFWGWCDGAGGRLPKFVGIPKSTFPLHLKECVFRYNHRHDLDKALKSLLKDV